MRATHTQPKYRYSICLSWSEIKLRNATYSLSTQALRKGACSENEIWRLELGDCRDNRKEISIQFV